MRSDTDAIISAVEHAYSLEGSRQDWVSSLVDAVAPLADQGRGVLAGTWMGTDADGVPLIGEMATNSASLVAAYARLATAIEPEELIESSHALAGRVNLMSEERQFWPSLCGKMAEYLDCEDILTFFSVDPDLGGIVVAAPASNELQLGKQQRWRLQQLTVHLAAGARLRRTAMPDGDGQQGIRFPDMVEDDAVLLDPKRFDVAHATIELADSESLEVVRDAAKRVDRARGKLRRTDPSEALQLWEGLVRGRWSLVDWFDSDGRRFVLAKPNAPDCGDPRGLSERELQVATYVARGESQKLVSYRFGLSSARVSQLLRQAKRKLKVRTQAELVDRFYPGRLLMLANQTEES